MDTPGIILLVVSASISFGLGRLFVYFRDKKRKEKKEQALKRAAQALRDAPPEAESKNKSKRKRQLNQQKDRF
ncbi:MULTISPECIES: hypothetical protein [Polaromonas]|uniref:Uncharacterized protein n=1 Tax=Polaromonas aquatica TaxID=332657 RepID=A0ABW1U3F1_9BURK